MGVPFFFNLKKKKFIPFTIFALLFSLPPSRNSDPGSRSKLFPLPTAVCAFHFYRDKAPAVCSLVDSRRIAPVLGRWILTIEAQGVIVGLLDDVWSCCQTQPSFSSPSRVALPSPVCSTTPRFAWDAASTLKSSRSVAGLRCPASKKELSLVFPYRGGVYVNCFLSGAPPPYHAFRFVFRASRVLGR